MTIFHGVEVGMLSAHVTRQGAELRSAPAAV